MILSVFDCTPRVTRKSDYFVLAEWPGGVRIVICKSLQTFLTAPDSGPD